MALAGKRGELFHVLNILKDSPQAFSESYQREAITTLIFLIALVVITALVPRVNYI